MQPNFTVDTQLFRELGALLVGRDSTALAELIKNSYDADAQNVTVHAEGLNDPETGLLLISDDGHGMNAAQFESGFLRIASRAKTQSDRFSPQYHRRFTGAKGLGRLAAHKLSSFLQIDTTGWSDESRTSKETVTATIDWDQVEGVETIDQIGLTDAIQIRVEPVEIDAATGTLLTLKGLRRPWTEQVRSEFIREVTAYEPPSILIQPLPKSVLESPALFERPLVQDALPGSPGMSVQLEGDFAGGDEYWSAAVQAAHWVLEIDALDEQGTVKYAIVPTRLTIESNDRAQPVMVEAQHPGPDEGPRFQARILVRTGAWSTTGLTRNWIRQAGGIRVYQEGFRVLPYGGPGNDWLAIDSDYVRRSRETGIGSRLPRLDLEALGLSQPLGLQIAPNSAYVGGVFLTERNAVNLETLINREGFVAGAAYYNLENIVREGVNLLVRVRSLAEQKTSIKRRRSRSQSSESAIIPLRAAINSVNKSIDDGLTLLGEGSIIGATQALQEAKTQIGSVSDLLGTLISEQALLRILASVGTQMAAFVHEINNLLSQATTLEYGLLETSHNSASDSTTKATLSDLSRSASELRRALERQSAYLLDVVTVNARRRRSRQPIFERFNAGISLVSLIASRQGITIRNEIPDHLRTPPMFQAELVSVFSNLVTNAVKAAGDSGEVWAHAEMLDTDDAVLITVENTGIAVDPSTSEHLFDAFESSSVNVDPVLGKGMGMGLPITRTLLEDYGASIAFVEPHPGYSTAIAITMPGA